MEADVQERSVGVDTWQRTGVLTFGSVKEKAIFEGY